MIGVTIEWAANVFIENEYVYKNASFSESQLKKKHQSICIHWESEFMAADIIIVHKVNTNKNLDDLLTESLPGWKRVQLISRTMY